MKLLNSNLNIEMLFKSLIYSVYCVTLHIQQTWAICHWAHLQSLYPDFGLVKGIVKHLMQKELQRTQSLILSIMK